MKLQFTYNIDRDIGNIINGAKSVNSREVTKFHQVYIDQYGDVLDVEKLKKFIEEQDELHNLNIGQEIIAAEERWKVIGETFIERVEKLFGITYPTQIITVYLTHNQRCTYNIESNYFFLTLGSDFSNNIIMHELLHFYTWHAFGRKLCDGGLPSIAYNDIKESLTELLNLEFVDLMNGKSDRGYSQHQSMRAKINSMWRAKKDVATIIQQLAKDRGKNL